MKNKHLYKTLTILALTLATATGCAKNDDTVASTQAPSENIASTQEATPSAGADTTSVADAVGEAEAAKATEIAADAPSETAEATAETEENIREIIADLDLTKYENAAECIEDLKKYKTPMLIVYDHGRAKEILMDGDSYTYAGAVGDEVFFLNRSPDDGNIKAAYIALEEGNISAFASIKSYAFPFHPHFTNGLYPIVIEYNDGTKDELTIDFTFRLIEDAQSN